MACGCKKRKQQENVTPVVTIEMSQISEVKTTLLEQQIKEKYLDK